MRTRDHPPRQPAPVIRELAPGECAAILARNHVGRIAYAFRDRVDIEPIHYVFEDGWLYGRTSAGSKLDAIRRNPWVAFEVDEVAGLFAWTSVVARGSFHHVDAEGPPREVAAHDHALELLRDLIPDTLLPGDPVPWRNVVFRIAVSELNGREARPAS